MTMSQEQVNQILRPLIDRIVPLYNENKLGKDSEDFWAARAALSFSKNKNIDRGIFSIYFFNLVHLKKGEAIFQGAGLPHAYLEGQNVELMSNSDNVLRGGLTTKHIDVDELLKHVKCEATVPAILEGKETTSSTRLFKPPVKDFQLTVSELAKNETLAITANATEIILLTEGELEIPQGPVTIKPGQPVAVILKGTTYTLKGLAGKSTVFRASEAVPNG
jgi:mannose-6-phosphate isomerase